MGDEYGMYPMSVPIPQRQGQSDLVEKIKPDPIVEMIRHRLLGEELDLNTGIWVKIPELQVEALTPRGAWDISMMIAALSSINMTMGNIDERQMMARLRFLLREIIYKVNVNWKEYGIIADSGQIYSIKSMAMSVGLGTLSQAKEGHTSTTITGTQSTIETIQRTPQRSGFRALADRLLGKNGQ